MQRRSWCFFLWGRRIYSPQVGLLAAAFLALNVMHIQLSHFFTSDPYLAFFVVLALYFMVRGVAGGAEELISQDSKTGQGNWRDFLHRHSLTCNIFLAAAIIGLAVGSKFAAIMLFSAARCGYLAGQYAAALVATGRGNDCRLPRFFYYKPVRHPRLWL